MSPYDDPLSRTFLGWLLRELFAAWGAATLILMWFAHCLGAHVGVCVP